MANEFKVKNGLILESGSLSNTSQQFVLTYNTSSGLVFYATASAVGGGGGGAGFPYIGNAVITGSLTVSGSGITVTGSLNAPNITGSLLGTASWAQTSSQALTASYAANNLQLSSSGLKEPFIAGNQTFIISSGERLTSGTNEIWRVSGSFGVLQPGKYQIYTVLYPTITSGTIVVQAWITTTVAPTFNVSTTTTIQNDAGRVPGSQIRGPNGANLPIYINTPQFTVSTPTEYFLCAQSTQLHTSTTPAPSFSFLGLTSGTVNYYTIYKYS